MDTAAALPDSISDVNFLILDYLACLAIEGILSPRGQPGHDDIGWLLNSVNIINSITPPAPESAPDSDSESLALAPEIHSKLLILRFAAHFFLRDSHGLVDERPGGLFSLQVDHQDQDQDDRIYNLLRSPRHQQQPDLPRRKNTLSSLFPEFLSILACPTTNVNTTETETRRKHTLDIAARFVAVAVLEERVFAPHSQTETETSTGDDHICTRLSWTPSVEPMKTEFSRLRGKYLDSLFPSAQVDEQIGVDEAVLGLERAVATFLFELMASLDPPVLLQLERGQLAGLSRAETLALKDRVGLV